MTKVFEALKYEERHAKVVRTKTPPTITRDQRIKSGARLDIAETMMGLYQTIGSALPDTPRKIIQFVGSCEGEGTSTIVRELTRVSALRMGKSVLILDADRARPCQPRFFGVSPHYYLEDAMRNGGSAEKIFSQYGDNNLFVGLLSRESTSIAELLDSQDTTRVFDALRKQFDLILIDCPPIRTSPDSLAICRVVDGVVLVVEAENTRWPVAEATKDRIIQSGGNLLGMVLSKRQFHIPEYVYRRL
jgi:Mrp family chromosome partitioning ATPase